MKSIALGLFVLALIALQAPQANAVVCARGVYHAGCAGPRGAVVTHPHRAVVHPAVVHPAVVRRHCYWRAGVRVCR